MGGKVFSSGLNALFTPRLAREVYGHAQQQCFAALRPLFPLVRSPIEAPEKTTFGDVDVLACLEGSTFTADEIDDPEKADVWAAVERQLRAARTHQESKLVKNFACPWPPMSSQMMARQLAVEAATGGEAVRCGDEAVASGGEAGKQADQKARYIQVDVHLCATKQELEWSYFHYAHGDLWNIVGSIIRPHGLVVTGSALHICIPEIEPHDKKAARVFLTNNPTEALDFLGLPHGNGEWEVPFASVEELFEYAARCRWNDLWPRKSEDDYDARKAAVCRKLIPSDRRRMKTRPIFARWIDEWVPARQARARQARVHRIVPIGRRAPRAAAVIRDEVRAAAFRAFPDAKAAWDARIEAWHAKEVRMSINRELIKTDACLPGPEEVARVVPAPREGGGTAREINAAWRGVLRSALVRIVLKDDCTGFEGVVAPPNLKDERGFLRAAEVKAWIAENWEAVGREAWRQKCALAAEVYLAKELMGEDEEATAFDGASVATAATGRAEDKISGGPVAA